MRFVCRFGFLISALPLVILVLTQSQYAKEPARIRFTINDDWRFVANDVEGAWLRTLSDSEWQRVTIPHTWNALDAFDDEPGYRRGPSWYRRELRLGQELRNKRIFLYLEGANHTADVYVNENKAGHHFGGYTAFTFDITEYLEFGRPNLIAVRVDNTHDREKPPIDGDFTMYGGIYRDVWLIVTENVHFTVADHASPGVRIETPRVSEKSASVKISGKVMNTGPAARSVEIESTILYKGRAVAEARTKFAAPPGTEQEFEHTAVEVTRPRLWSPDQPNLYSIRTRLREGRRLLDEVSNPLGFRWFRLDAKNGFFLNGKPLRLRGTNRHQDHAGLGNALPNALHVRDLEIIKENGFNFLRLAHYPQDPAVLDAADRLGLIIWEEIPIVNQIHVSPVFNGNAKSMLREMIRQHRNHPSVIIWGYMNEVFLPVPKSEETLEATVKLARDLEKICKDEDPSRVTAIAFDHGARELYHTSGLSSITDAIGWNLYHGWYYGSVEDLGKFLDEEHARYPSRPLILSEYGANGDRRLNSSSPKRFDSTIQWQRMLHESYLQQIDARQYLAASAIWNQFDFGSEFRGETIPHINQKGLYTYDRKPKDISYFYRANLSLEPVLHISVRDGSIRGEVEQTIVVYTNLKAVELLHNGRSLGIRSPDGHKRASWNVNLANGRNVFLARASAARGRTVSDVTEVHFSDSGEFIRTGSGTLAINAGSNAEFIDEDRTFWTSDRKYGRHGWGFIGENVQSASTGRNVLDSEDDPLLQTMLEGLAGYRFDVPAGSYEVELRFVESQTRNTGERVFGVKVNGKELSPELDLLRECGLMRACMRIFRVDVVAGQGILIDFVKRRGNPVLSGVKLTGK